MAIQKDNKPLLMGVINLTPDSFYAPSRAETLDAVKARISALKRRGCSIFDVGAVSTRPGAEPVDVETEWARLEAVLSSPIAAKLQGHLSIDTTSAEIVRRVYDKVGRFIVNDISAGEDDPEMLETVASLGLPFVAMHKRGNPQTMDDLCDYPDGVVNGVLDYFKAFSVKADALGIKDWILDPGFGFAKTNEQNWELLEHLSEFKVFGRPVLAGIADKRFTRGHSRKARSLAMSAADILRIH